MKLPLRSDISLSQAGIGASVMLVVGVRLQMLSGQGILENDARREL
jgi:hypothetical protein